MFGLKVQIIIDIFVFFFLFPKTSGINLFVLLLPLPQHLFEIVGMTIVIGLV